MEAAAEPVLPLMELPNGLMDRIAYLLPPDGRRSLAATCTALCAAGHRWFRGAVVRASSGDDWLDELALWLEERQVLVAYHPGGTVAQIQAGLASLPAGRVAAIRQWGEPSQWAQPSLSALTVLTSLSLSGQTQLSSGGQLQQILQPLAQLRVLILSRCELRALPAALVRCTQLTQLWLDDNRLTHGWQHLRPLVQLQRLWLGGTAHIPASLQSQTQLTLLHLEHSTNVLAGSHHLTALRLLRDLSLDYCRLEEVPDALSALTSLVELYIGGNELRGGFDHLRPLAQLQYLGLYDSGLTEVPAAIAALTALTMLHVASTVQSGWHHLRPLAQLGALDVLVRDLTSQANFDVARSALLNLHPGAVERMAAGPGGDFLQQVFATFWDDSFSDYQALMLKAQLEALE